MSTYVMSDIHGNFSAMNQLLDKVGFSNADRLIIAGDIIDRGNENFEMLNWILNKPANVEIVLGNHDYKFIKYVDILTEYSKYYTRTMDIYRAAAIENYAFDQYGTIKKLIRKHNLRAYSFKKWADVMKKFPLYINTNIISKKTDSSDNSTSNSEVKRFLIVHAGYIDEKTWNECKDLPEIKRKYDSIETFYMNARDEGYILGGRKDTTIIAGHTPTVFDIDIVSNEGKVFKYEKENMNCTIYDIDCGYAYKKEGYDKANLACIRLEDEQIFYLDE